MVYSNNNNPSGGIIDYVHFYPNIGCNSYKSKYGFFSVGILFIAILLLLIAFALLIQYGYIAIRIRKKQFLNNPHLSH